MKRGDLVAVADKESNNYGDGRIVGMILTWVRYGGPEDACWEVLWSDGDIQYWDESDLEVISENR